MSAFPAHWQRVLQAIVRGLLEQVEQPLDLLVAEAVEMLRSGLLLLAGPVFEAIDPGRAGFPSLTRRAGGPALPRAGRAREAGTQRAEGAGNRAGSGSDRARPRRHGAHSRSGECSAQRASR